MDSTLISKSSGEENNTDVQNNCRLLQTPQQTRPKRFRKTSSSSSSNYDYIESLPVDLTFEILVRVPARDVHNSARLVCRKWHKIVSTRDFKRAHLHRSPCGLLAHDSTFSTRHLLTFVAKADGDNLLIETSKLNHRTQNTVLSTCNGLLLAARVNPTKPFSFYVMNPATDQKLDLPRYFSENRLTYGCAMAYVATTMEYKVVRSVIPIVLPKANCVDILTVGVDKDWMRRVNIQHLSRDDKKLLLSSPYHPPLTTQGFVHWARGDEGRLTWAGYERQYGHVLTLNVETEIITQFRIPSLRREDGLIQVIYLPMGSYLSLLVLRSEFSWELWEMKPETGEWTQMPSINLLEENSEMKLKPVGWLRPREVLVFGARNNSCVSYFAFTVRTRKLQEFTLDGRVNRFLVHTNSLVWIN